MDPGVDVCLGSAVYRQDIQGAHEVQAVVDLLFGQGQAGGFVAGGQGQLDFVSLADGVEVQEVRIIAVFPDQQQVHAGVGFEHVKGDGVLLAEADLQAFQAF